MTDKEMLAMADGADLLADLTPAQREAVTHFEGPLLILAAAGSGKTRVITRRVAWLLEQGVRPGNIVWISTFHSFGARVLRQYAERLNLDRHYTIYDQADRARLVKTALEDA